jgi:nucleoside phosphorylase
MMEATAFKGKFVLLAGSASRSCPKEKLNFAHAFVRYLTCKVLELGGGFVLFASAEPTTDDSSSTPLIFDWVVLREIDRYLVGDADLARPCVFVVTSQKAWSRKMTEAHRQLLARLSGSGAADIVYVDDDVHTGGNIGDEQVQRADAMIAIGGGKGVADRAHKIMQKGRPVLPLDITLGALNNDGGGAVGLHKKLGSEPQRFFPQTHARVRSQIPSLSLDLEGSDAGAVATRVAEVIASEFAAGRAGAPIEVTILTALPVELSAVQVAMGLSTESPAAKTSSGTTYWAAEIQSRRSSHAYRVAVACIGGAGNVEAAAATTELMMVMKPKLVVMVGIAAGMRGKCRLGDVVLSDRVVAYEPAAAVIVDGASIEVPRPEGFKVAHTIHQDVVSYLADAGLPGRLSQSADGTAASKLSDVSPELVAETLSVRRGTMGSGEKLLRDPAKFRTLRTIHGKIEVAEMEAAGVATACHRAGACCLIVRGISDFGDDTKDDRFHALAAARAATVTVDFIREGLRL